MTGGTLRLSAQPLNKKGKPLTGLSISWASSSPAVVAIDQNGLATAVGPGVAQIFANSSGVVGKATLTVALVPARTEVVSGDGQTRLIGTILEGLLRLQVLDGAGAPVGGVPVTFTVLDGGGVVFPSSVPTGKDGVAGVQWMLGRDPKQPQRVEASVGGLSSQFQATALWPPLQILTAALPRGRLTVDYDGKLEASASPGLLDRPVSSLKAWIA